MLVQLGVLLQVRLQLRDLAVDLLAGEDGAHQLLAVQLRGVFILFLDFVDVH